MAGYNKKTGSIHEVFRPETGDVPIPIGLAKAVDHVRDKKIALKRSLESPEERTLRENREKAQHMEMVEILRAQRPHRAGVPRGPYQSPESIDRQSLKMRTDVNGVTTPAHKQRLLSDMPSINEPEM